MSPVVVESKKQDFRYPGVEYSGTGIRDEEVRAIVIPVSGQYLSDEVWSEHTNTILPCR